MAAFNDLIILKAGDDNPSLTGTLRDKVSGNVVDISASTTTVAFRFRAQGATTILQNVTCSKIDSGYTGQFKVDWPATALDVTAGRYEGEIEIDFNGTIQSVIDPKQIRFLVRDDFAQTVV